MSVNAVYWLMCIPIITSGLANVGITNVTRNIARDKHSFMLSDFFETIKKNWKQATIVTVINTIVYLLVFFALRFYYFSKGKFFQNPQLAFQIRINFQLILLQYYPYIH